MPDPLESYEARGVRASLTERGVVVEFTVAAGPIQRIRWMTCDAAQVRDLARQLASLAHALPGGAECICAFLKPPCPVHGDNHIAQLK